MLNQPRSEADHKNVIEQGFTLVELLIVIVILGILAGIVVFAVSNLTGDASKNACKTEVSTVTSAAEVFKAREGVYPTSMANLTTGVTKGPGTAAEIAASGLATWPETIEPLLKSSPKQYLATVPAAGSNQFTITFLNVATPTSFAVGACL